jgi:uncharacterized protein (TIGR02466 family)
MENNYQIIPLFPIPLCISRLPNNLSTVTDYFDQQEILKQEPEAVAEYGDRSKNSYILDEPECSELKSFILNLALEFSTNTLGYSCTSYKFSQSWISLKSPGHHHKLHTHPNSIISGVIYYGEYLPDTPLINFHKPTSNIVGHLENNLISIPHSSPLPSSSLPYVGNIYPFTPTPGDIIMFHSSLPHSVPKNTTNKVRKSLAFNIVPTEGFGDEHSLTRLKFN